MRNHFLRASLTEVDPAWNLNYAKFTGTPQNFFSVAQQENTPQGVFFKPDGTKMYVVGTNDDRVYQYDLSTAWEVGTATYSNKNKFISSQAPFSTDLFFKSDGTKMYIIGSFSDSVFEYDLSTAWDVSTASYLQNFSVATEETFPLGLFFKPDGTKMYVIGTTNDSIYEYTLSTAWDISTASYSQSYNVSAQEQSPSAVFFKSDGTVMYVLGDLGNDVTQYNLFSAWNIATAIYAQTFYVGNRETSPSGLFFKPDGTKMYMIGSQSDTVIGFSLSTAWDISTASFTYPSTEYLSVATQDLLPASVFFKPDGTKMYVIGFHGDDVNEYSLSTAWQIGTASYIQIFSVSAQDTLPLGLFFKPDGTKMFMIGNNADTVNEYSLSTAWDISTASYVQNFSVSAQTTNPSAVFFKDDGTKMYITNAGGKVHEYSLSTAWDISTLSYDQDFTVDQGASGLFFKDDGSKMYVCSYLYDHVTSYSLSSAWDISTASAGTQFSVKIYETSARGIFFKPDGTKMFIVGTDADAVWAFDLAV